MNFLLLFTFKHLLLLHNGSIVIKLKSVFLLSLPFSAITWLISEITKWSISNSSYIAGVLTCIAIDHVVGSIYHALKAKDFTFKKNAVGLITKLAMCAGAAILFEIIHNVVKEATLVYDYLKIVTRLIVILYPAGSAFMNMSALTNGVFPPLGWISKIKAFNKDLDLERFSNKNSNGPTNN
ncbi:hypothetical protein DVK85_06610 [Flavobacterium arcticum]|uniref:Holin n=1 Tax=Flavobacterium arcticum TaxID=1784713 RepID=A0A345HBH1_9FLAO|nr:hypothetical protein [Flavobacterium arcticum]AXG73931.1 hypothetical protein DVK85_06610 [Flavobacterium arcticum]KAF2508907.1 hypothetical protein E0W72_10095 [Flavobacterium arcticum]